MLETTRNKLSEAGFFLRKLAQQEQRIFKTEPEAVGYFLSAFLSAARSVTDFIIAEEGDRYKQWWAQRKNSLTPDERKLLKFTNEQRVESVHVKGAQIEAQTTYISAHELQVELYRDGGTFEMWSGIPGTLLPQVARSTIHFMGYDTSSVAEIKEDIEDCLPFVMTPSTASQTFTAPETSPDAT